MKTFMVDLSARDRLESVESCRVHIDARFCPHENGHASPQPGGAKRAAARDQAAEARGNTPQEGRSQAQVDPRQHWEGEVDLPQLTDASGSIEPFCGFVVFK